MYGNGGRSYKLSVQKIQQASIENFTTTLNQNKDKVWMKIPAGNYKQVNEIVKGDNFTTHCKG